MDKIQKMKRVDELTSDISEKLGRLTNQGVFSAKEAIGFIKTMSDKQYEWMESNFTPDEIRDFVISKNR